MNEFNDFIQNNWFESGTLLVQGAILAIIVWYARKTLKTIRASQEQVGALLRLSLSDMIAERSPSATTEDAPVLTSPEQGESDGSHLLGAGRGVVDWLQAPMGGGGGVNPLRRVIRWLQSPAGS
jgi:hypothetical protein